MHASRQAGRQAGSTVTNLIERNFSKRASVFLIRRLNIHLISWCILVTKGPFYLTNLLLEKLKASAPSRVVTVASKVHEMFALDFNDLQLEHGWQWFKAYGRSKTANILFSQHLAKVLNGII
jgi:NAD(P)-dependent dehydrogenase (short-subunit alcohol dehydrogenase family)